MDTLVEVLVGVWNTEIRRQPGWTGSIAARIQVLWSISIIINFVVTADRPVTWQNFSFSWYFSESLNEWYRPYFDTVTKMAVIHIKSTVVSC